MASWKPLRYVGRDFRFIADESSMLLLRRERGQGVDYRIVEYVPGRRTIYDPIMDINEPIEPLADDNIEYLKIDAL